MSTATKVLNINSLVEQSNNCIAEIKKEQGALITATARNLGFIAFSLVGVFMASFIIFQIITGVIALFVGVAGVIVMFYALRYLQMNDEHIKRKMRNRVVAKMIEEAKTYKLETLTNLVIDSEARLKTARKARNKMGGYVERLKARLRDSDPCSTSYVTKQEMCDRVEQAYEVICTNVKQAAIAHKSLSNKVAEYRDMSEFADIAEDAMAFASTETSSLEQMLGMEAFAAIDQDFQQAMVSIENSVADFEIDKE